MQISGDPRQFTLRADAELANSMRNAIEFSRRIKKRFTSVFSRSSTTSNISSTRVEGASRDVVNARAHNAVSIVVAQNPKFCAFADLTCGREGSPKTLGEIIKSFNKESSSSSNGPSSSNEPSTSGPPPRPRQHRVRPRVVKSPSLETLENFPAYIADCRLSTPRKNYYPEARTPPLTFVEETSTDNSTLNDSRETEDTVSIGMDQEQQIIDRLASEDPLYTCKPETVQIEEGVYSVRCQNPDHRDLIDYDRLQCERYQRMYGESSDSDGEGEYVERTPVKRLRIAMRVPSPTTVKSFGEGPSGDVAPVNITPTKVTPTKRRSKLIDHVSPPRFCTIIEEEPESPSRPNSLASQSKSRNIFSSSSSSDESSATIEEDLKVEVQPEVVVLRDPKSISPRALTRKLSPINAVDSKDDLETILIKQEEHNKQVAEAMEKSKKSIFDSDSDDDLFKPVVTSNATLVLEPSDDEAETPEYNLYPSANSTLVSPSSTPAQTVKAPESILADKSEKKQTSWSSDASSDSDENLFKPTKKPEVQKVVESKKMEKTESKVVKSLFSDDSDDDLFRSPSVKKVDEVDSLGEMNARAPGKLNVAAFGGKLNNVLMNGPPGAKKSPLSSGEEPDAPVKVESKLKGRVPGKLDAAGISGKLAGLLVNGPPGAAKPKVEKKTQDDEVAPITASLTGALKSRPRGPANRRPPTRSMILAPSAIPESDPEAQPIKKSHSDDEIVGPLHF